MATEKPEREAVIRKLKEIAFSESNDAVKLLYLNEKDMDALDGLDLRLLTGVKRKDTDIEVRLVDRLAAVELLARLMGSDEAAAEERAGAFLLALEKTAERLWAEPAGNGETAGAAQAQEAQPDGD